MISSPARILLLGVAALVASRLHAQTTFQVGPGQSIQAAIDQAQDGDRILVAPGSYTEPIDYKGKAIAILATGGPLATTIDALGLQVPVVSFHSGEDPSSLLQGFTIAWGETIFGVEGGGISAAVGFLGTTSRASPTIRDCIIRDCNGSAGGGVAGDPIMERCVIRSNYTAGQTGGGIWGAPQLRQCVIAFNNAIDGTGGGLTVEGGSATLEDCVIVSNSAGIYGGAGGGVHVRSGALTMTRCVVAQNSAGSPAPFLPFGGGIHADSSSILTLTNCTIVANKIGPPNPNSAGGIDGPATLVNCIVWGNTDPQVSGLIAATYCDVQGGAAGAGNLNVPPFFVDELGRDYHLDAASPCIDHGDPSLLDADDTRSDIGAHCFRSLYAESNTTSSLWTNPSWSSLSLQSGGRQSLRLVASPSLAGNPYVVLGTFSGTRPGFSFQGMHVPLNPDFYTRFSFSNPSTPPLQGFAGLLDAQGRARSQITLSAGEDPALAGMVVHHVFGVFDSSGLAFVSNPEALSLEP